MDRSSFNEAVSSDLASIERMKTLSRPVSITVPALPCRE